MKGAEGYFWLGLVVVVFIFIIATILATPLTALTYVFVKRRLEGKYIILGSSLKQSTYQHFLENIQRSRTAERTTSQAQAIDRQFFRQ
jgi:hypothetical protein